MPASHRPIEVSGPFLGLELRETHQKPQHATLSVNVDYSRGYVEARPALRQVDNGAPHRARLHWFDTPDGSANYLLAVGLDDEQSPTAIQFRAYDLSGTATGALVDVTAAHGDVPDQRFDCSFVNAMLPTSGDVRFVCLITTANNTYVFEPAVDETTVRRLNTAKTSASGDAIRMNEANFSYWDTVPRGRIAVEHQGRAYYAGFGSRIAAYLTSVLEADQNQVPEAVVSSDRAYLTLGPHHVAYSDEFDPAGIQAHHVFAVEETEKITGLHSFQESLVVFTDRSVYVMTGGTDQTFALYRSVVGVGCVAPHSITEVEGNLFWMGHDGVYQWSGGAGAKRISDPIEPLFTGNWTPSPLPAGVSGLKHPFRIAHGDLPLCQAMHYRERRQIWWSLPVQGRRYMSFALTLVYDYQHEAWSMYTMSPRLYEDPTCMFDGVTVPTVAGREQVFTSGHSNGAAVLQGLGGSVLDTAAGRAVPLVWASTKLRLDNDTVVNWRRARLKILSNGKDSIPMAARPQVFATGARWAADAEATSKQEQQTDLSLHPKQTVTSFWGTGTWGTMKWSQRDWFPSDSKLSITSPWIRVGFVDDPDTNTRPPLVVMRSLTIEQKEGHRRGA